MSKFVGFTCDVCSSIWIEENKTIATVKFSGFRSGNQAKQDLCPACVDEFSNRLEGTWTSTARRKKSESDTIEPVAFSEWEGPVL